MSNLVIVHKNWANTYSKNKKKILAKFYSSNRRDNIPPRFSRYVTIPQNFDWRTVQSINPCGDQLQTGLCYLFASLYSFSDRYSIVEKQPFIRMSIVEAATVLKVKDINDDPMNNGDPAQFSQIFDVQPSAGTVKDAVPVGTVKEGNNTLTNLSLFCKSITSGDAKDCKCQRNCDDDDWQTQISEKLPNSLDVYKNLEMYPDRSKYDIKVTNMDDAIDFNVLVPNVFNGPIPYVFYFNGDLWRDNTNGQAWKQTGNIYMCIDWENTSNPFGYTAKGASREGGGHVISIIGYGTDNVNMNYKGKTYTVNVNYVWCRNSWGQDSDKAFFKAAWKQTLNLGGNVEIMPNVWRGTSIIDLIPKVAPVDMYDCIQGSCKVSDTGKYTIDECNTNCKPEDKYDCIEGECVPSINGQYDITSCTLNCEKIKPKNDIALISSLIIFSVIGIIMIIMLIIYVRRMTK